MEKETSVRHYFHGDITEFDPNQLYCASCDLFVDFVHFCNPKHQPPKCMNDLERYLYSVKMFAKRDKRDVRTRPENAPNLFANCVPRVKEPRHKWSPVPIPWAR